MKIVLRGRIVLRLLPKILLLFMMPVVAILGGTFAAHLAYASDLVAPTNLIPLDGATIRGDDYTQRWSTVSSAVKYEYESYYDATGLSLKYAATYAVNYKQAVGITDTSYWWRVRAVDGRGAKGPWSPLWKLTIDNTAPVVSLKSSGTGLVAGYYRGNVSVMGTVAGQEKNMASHAFVVTRPDGSTVSTGQIADTSLSRALSVDTSAGDGTYRVQYTATDKAGNVSAPVETSFVVDTTSSGSGPTLLGDMTRYMRPGEVTRSWEKSGSSDVYAYYYKSFKSYNDAANNPETTNYNFVYTWVADAQDRYNLVSQTGADERTFYYRVAALDKAGNKTWSDQIYSVTVDATAPLSRLDDLGMTPLRGTVTVTGAVSDNYMLHDYNLSLYPASVDLSDGSEHATSRIAIAGNGWTGADTTVAGVATPITRMLDTTKLADGDYQVWLKAADEAGNNSSPVVQHFTVDNTAPITAITSPTQSRVNSDLTVRATVMDKHLMSYTYMIKKDGVIISNQTVTSTGETDVALSTLTAEGIYEITLSARDEAGNESTVVMSVTIDKTSPIVTLTDIEPIVVGQDVVVHGTVTDSSVKSVAIYKDDSLLAGDVPVVSGEFAYTVAGLAVGKYEIAAKARDDAENLGVSDTKIALVKEVTMSPANPVVNPPMDDTAVPSANSPTGGASVPVPTSSVSPATTPETVDTTEVASGSVQKVAAEAPVVGGSDDIDNAEVAIKGKDVSLSPVSGQDGQTGGTGVSTGQEVKGASTINWWDQLSRWWSLVVFALVGTGVWLFIGHRRRRNRDV